MDLTGILVWLAVLVSLVLLIVMLVKAKQQWGTLHIVLLALLFLQSWIVVFCAAGIASRRNAAMKTNFDLQNSLASKLIEEQRVRDGERVNPVADMNAYVPVTNELNRLLVERGRVWRNATVGQISGNEVSVLLSTGPAVAVAVPGDAAGNGPAANAASSAGLSTESVVQVFGERTDERGSMPAIYLGEFVVTASDGGNIKMKPTANLSPEQSAAIAGGRYPTWSIYELMPLDSHTAFAAEGSKEEENSVFGRMDLQQLAQLLGIDPSLAQAEPTSLSVGDAIKARALQSYINDGGPLPEGTPPEQTSYRVEFLKDYTIEVDEPGNRTATEGGFYDATTGRSVDARLKRGEDGAKVSFKPGEVVIVDAASADELSKQGFVKLLAPIYVRPLNDYEYAFREVRRQITAALQDAKLIERELAEMQRSQGIADNQVRVRQQEGAKLQKDKDQYSLERDVITAEANRLDQAVATMRSDLSNLFKQMQAMRDALVENQRAATAAIDAVAPAPSR